MPDGDAGVHGAPVTLSLRRFTESDLDVARLNHADPLDNFRWALAVEEVVFDGTSRCSITCPAAGRSERGGCCGSGGVRTDGASGVWE
jgi:hypothetical protein